MEVRVQCDIFPPMRPPSCWPLVATAVLSGCVQFHPRHPAWLPPDRGATAATAASPAADAIDAIDATEATDASAIAASLPGYNGPGWQVVGHSVQGRPLRTLTLGHGPRKVLWIGGIHGNEREGSVATAELPVAFLTSRGATAAVTLTILEDSNPDGSAQGTRGNANGVDLNRNFPATNFVAHRQFGISPLSQPESRAVHDLIRSLGPDLVIVAHSWNNDRFINFDGPAAALAQRFSRLSSYPLRESTEIAPTPGSLGAWVGHILAVPILTLEYRRGRNPVAAWHDTRVAILAVILDDDELAAVPRVRAATS